MDDLRDLSWQSPSVIPPNGNGKQTNANYNIISLGSNNPFSQNNTSKSSSTTNVNSFSSSPAKGDSFGGLVNFGTKKTETLSLAQQAGRLL